MYPVWHFLQIEIFISKMCPFSLLTGDALCIVSIVVTCLSFYLVYIAPRVLCLSVSIGIAFIFRYINSFNTHWYNYLVFSWLYCQLTSCGPLGPFLSFHAWGLFLHMSSNNIDTIILQSGVCPVAACPTVTYNYFHCIHELNTASNMLTGHLALMVLVIRHLSGFLDIHFHTLTCGFLMVVLCYEINPMAYIG